jgi:predicted Zn-dependent protease
LIPIAIITLLLCVLLFSERHDTSTRVGLGAIMRIVGGFERNAERVPLAVTRVSDEEENRLGVLVAGTYRLSDRGADRIDQIGQRLARHVQRKQIHYHFYLQDDPGFLNAFALPGGQIVVGKGLVDMTESDDELAAALGHEITHVDRRHAIERMQYELAARKLKLSLPYALMSFPITIFQAGYQKELELEADRGSVDLLAVEGYSQQAAVILMKRFQTKFEATQIRDGSPVNEAARVLAEGLAEYFRSHPPAAERISEIEKEMGTQNTH